MAEAEEDANESGDQKQQSEDVGEDQGAGDGLSHQHDAERDVENAQEDLPYKSSPSLGPEGVNDLEGACGNGDPTDKDGADPRS